jgi:hypothetical protein
VCAQPALPACLPRLPGLQVFEEYSEEGEGMVLVTRDPTLSDNALLPGDDGHSTAQRVIVPLQYSTAQCSAVQGCMLACCMLVFAIGPFSRAPVLLLPLKPHPAPTRSHCVFPAARYYERLGDRLYHNLVEGFREEQFGGPQPCAPGELRAGAACMAT